MKQIIFLLLIFYILGDEYGRSDFLKVSFQKRESVFVLDVNTPDTLYFSILLHVEKISDTSSPAFNDIKLNISSQTSNFENVGFFNLVGNPMIKESDFKNANKFETELILRITGAKDSIIKNRCTVTLCIDSSKIIKTENISMHFIRFTKKYNSLSFREQKLMTAIGTNLDFFDKLEMQDLYAEITLLRPDIVYGHGGFNLGLYQNKSITKSSGELVELTKDLCDKELFDKYEISRDPIIKTTSSNFGLFFSILVSFYNGVDRNSDKITIFGSLHLEAIKATLNTETKYLLSQIDSTQGYCYKVNDSISINKDYVIYQKYFGFGVPLFFQNDNIEIFVRPVFFGWEWTHSSESKKEKKYYSCKFNIVEKKYGITIGGEYKGLYNDNEISINVFIAKYFDIAKLFDL